MVECIPWVAAGREYAFLSDAIRRCVNWLAEVVIAMDKGTDVAMQSAAIVRRLRSRLCQNAVMVRIEALFPLRWFYHVKAQPECELRCVA